jgi:parallel beta-helix repeat protein
MKHETAPLWTVGLLTIALTSPALAVDGVLEINQACAVNTGCFSGDAAGLPVTITGAAGHSYRLTGDLTVPDENTDGIVVSGNDVGIDLNNFAIIGPVTCSASPLVCSPASGTGSGVERTSSSILGTLVKNGSITGMGDYGVYLGRQAQVTNLRVRWNGDDGIYASSGSMVSGNTAYQNGDNGIYAFSGSTVSGNTVYENVDDGIDGGSGLTVSGNTAYENGDDGIYTDSGSTVSGNTARENGDDGIYAEAGSMVSGNAAYGNGGDGIYANTGSTVSGNTAYDNGGNGIEARSGSTVSGNTARSNGDSGIFGTNGSTVSGNTVRGNTGYGLRFSGTESAYSGNVISGSLAGTIDGSAVQLGQNACNGNTTCP